MATFPILQNATGGSSSSGTNITLTWTNNTLAGNLIIVGISSSQAVSSITDTVGNIYTQISTGTNSVIGRLYYAKNTNPGTTPTITVNVPNGTQIAAIAREYAGASLTNPLDKQASTTNTFTNPDNSPITTVINTPTQLVVGWDATNSVAATVGAGFGHLNSTDGGSASVFIAIEDLTTSTIGTQQSTFATSGGSNSVTGVATFMAHVTNKPSNALRPHLFSPGLAR